MLLQSSLSGSQFWGQFPFKTGPLLPVYVVALPLPLSPFLVCYFSTSCSAKVINRQIEPCWLQGWRPHSWPGQQLGVKAEGQAGDGGQSQDRDPRRWLFLSDSG